MLPFRVLGASFSSFGCFVLRSSFSSASFSKLPVKHRLHDFAASFITGDKRSLQTFLCRRYFKNCTMARGFSKIYPHSWVARVLPTIVTAAYKNISVQFVF